MRENELGISREDAKRLLTGIRPSDLQELKRANENKVTFVWRRYQQFRGLWDALKKEGIEVPILPPKGCWDRLILNFSTSASQT